MALTREFRQTVQARVRRDPSYAKALLSEAVQAMLDGELDVGKSLARDYINASIGFEELGRRLAVSPKSLMRMFSTNGNPQASNLFAVLDVLQADAGIALKVVPAVRRQRAGARANA